MTTNATSVFSLEADRYREELRDKRARLRRNPGDRLLELDIESQEERVRILDRDHAAIVKRDQDRAAAEKARLLAQADEREEALRLRFEQRFPGGSDQDYQALRPALLAELSNESAAVERDAMAESRRRVRI